MDAYILEWLNLLVRWAHLVVGIAWIGASFYFIWLDDHLEAPQRPEDAASGVGGELWAVHGGGFYRAQKFRVAPPELPETLHWFKWEAYWTWITGFVLLVIVYYVDAELYLIDPAAMPLSRPAAIAIGLASLAAGWLVYDVLCRSALGANELALGAVLLALLAAAAWGLAQVFSGRGAFIHYGAILGTIMAANVAMVIIPGQRELVRAMAEGRAPDPRHGIAGKQRSVHNTYFTLPVLFVMISNHYAMTFGQRFAWLVLVALTVAGALIRVWFVMRHKGSAPAWPLAVAMGLLVLLAALIAPRSAGHGAAVSLSEVQGVMDRRCASCHAEKPSFPGLAQPPKGVLLDSPERTRAQALVVHRQTVLSRAMPPGNLTGLTDEERALLDRWYRSGAKR